MATLFRVPPTAPPHLLLSAGPDSPGAAEFLAAFVHAAGAQPGATVLLTERGLAWASTDALRRLGERLEAEIVVCSRSARDAGWRLDDGSAPDHVRWSSLATWLADRPQEAVLWTALP